jgi:hypothetical protein
LVKERARTMAMLKDVAGFEKGDYKKFGVFF